MNDWEGDPDGIGLPWFVSPDAGLNHSTANRLDAGIAVRSTVTAPPDGA
jgi:hypothetical protein